MSLSFEEIVASAMPKILEVPVPQWNGSVYLKVMALGDRDAYERKWIGKKETGIPNFRAEYLVRTWCDKDGNRLFSDDQVPMVAAMDGNITGKLFDKAMDLNGMNEGSVEAAGKS